MKTNTLKLPKPSYQLNRESMIVAQVIISESELAKVILDYTAQYESEKPAYFKQVLYALGLDTSLVFHRQDGLKHRNKFNEVVICSRYIGEERQDEEWINSGYASPEAKDKYTRNRMVEDLYRMRNLTKDTQAALESKDRYTVIDESVWE